MHTRQACLARILFCSILAISMPLCAKPIAFGEFEEEIYTINPVGTGINRYLWSQYPSGDLSGRSAKETGKLSIISHSVVSGKHALQVDVDVGAAYLQFYPYNYPKWLFISEVIEEKLKLGKWQADYYNRMEFFVKAPTALRTAPDEKFNMAIGTYVRSKTGKRSSAESGGSHYYHRYNVTANEGWTKVIWDMHPTHKRGKKGGTEQGYLPYPTNEKGHNYFDALTRFYVDFEASMMDGKPSTWLFDGFKLYHEPHQENENKVYSLCGTYSGSNNQLIIGWNRHKDDNKLAHEVRYAFKNIHEIGWNKAKKAPGPPVSPQGWQGYNGMRYETSNIKVGDHDSIFVAVKPEDDKLFKQIEIPLKLNK